MALFYSKTSGGFYDSVVQGSSMPADVVPISTAEHAALMMGQAAGNRIEADASGYPVLVAPPPPSIAELAAQTESEVRRQSAAARDIWRTPGKDGVYRCKLDEVIAWRAAGEPMDLSPYPHLAAEIGITAPTAGELAVVWDAMAAAWVQASAGIEAVEQGALKAIRDAVAEEDIAAIEAVLQDLAWPTPSTQ